MPIITIAIKQPGKPMVIMSTRQRVFLQPRLTFHPTLPGSRRCWKSFQPWSMCNLLDDGHWTVAIKNGMQHDMAWQWKKCYQKTFLLMVDFVPLSWCHVFFLFFGGCISKCKQMFWCFRFLGWIYSSRCTEHRNWLVATWKFGAWWSTSWSCPVVFFVQKLEPQSWEETGSMGASLSKKQYLWLSMWAMYKNLVVLGYIGDSTTQFYWDDDKPL